jgi:peroxiredoxin
MAAMDPLSLPANLPVPQDDGGARHLPGTRLPRLALPATTGDDVVLADLDGWTVVFAYPRTGRPGEEPPGGEESWNAIPGARGCTPELCGVRDDHAALEALGARVFGLSTQDTGYQREAAERLALPYPLLSDEVLGLSRALDLPAFEVSGMTLLRRLTLLVHDGEIASVAYPVFPPDGAAAQALELLREALAEER